MKKIILFFILAVSIMACTHKEDKSDPVLDSLAVVNKDLENKVSERETDIFLYIKSMNEIQASLDEIKAKQKLVSNINANTELRKPQQEQIAEDIALISQLLEQNKDKLRTLRANVGKADAVTAELQQMIDRLMLQMEEKDKELAATKDQLVRSNAALENLFMEYNSRIEELSQKDEELNTAWYVFGTAKELKKNGVLTSEGGFIGIGKNDKLKADFNGDYFTKVDITITPSITLLSKKAKLITTHPDNSYRFEKNSSGTIEKLLITDSKQFWSLSKYLVVVIE
jgi:hypothetical protein